MADHPVERLGGKTLLQYASKPCMDELCKKGRCGLLKTIPAGYLPGSEVANTAILGYDLNKVYEGRGPLEAASIGYEMASDDLAIRCNIITLQDGLIKNHHGGHLKTEEAAPIVEFLNEKLGNERIKFILGIQYRHLLVIKGGSKHIVCAPPHDYPNKPWQPLLVKPEAGWEDVVEDNRMTASETASLINELILKSQHILANHPFNVAREKQGKLPANSIWPWSGGYRPSMEPLSVTYDTLKTGAVISAVDLIKGIGHYAGLKVIEVEGATGLADTNYEGKRDAAIKALKETDFVFLHVEASDEAGHDGDLELKLKTIDYLDHRIIKPIVDEISTWDEEVAVAILPDHPTPVETRTHVDEPVPFLIYYPGIEADAVECFDEVSCKEGSYGLLVLDEFMKTFMKN